MVAIQAKRPRARARYCNGSYVLTTINSGIREDNTVFGEACVPFVVLVTISISIWVLVFHEQGKGDITNK